jgi:ApbE superfamily uncharacterized protein (UPF0280 family)
MQSYRNYRNQNHSSRLKSFSVRVKETDLFIRASRDLSDITRELILKYRGYIETFIEGHSGFLESLVPWNVNEPAPKIISDMINAGFQAGVGPMAAVAGAMAEHVGLALLHHAEEVVVENGGDVFIKSSQAIVIGIFANRSPLSLRVGLRIDPQDTPAAVCTSSGTVGHSISFGKADAACVVSDSCSLADAAATAIGNRVKKKSDIASALEFGKEIKGVEGIVIIKDDKIGLWGNITAVPLKEKSLSFKR